MFKTNSTKFPKICEAASEETNTNYSLSIVIYLNMLQVLLDEEKKITI